MPDSKLSMETPVLISEKNRSGHARGSSLSAEERETTITATDADDLVRIWTCQRKHITKLRSNVSFTEVRSGFHGTTEWAEFTIPADKWNPASGAKRKHNMTPEQREAAATRLREFNKSQTG